MSDDEFHLDAINAAFDNLIQTTRDVAKRMKQMQVELARIEAISCVDPYVIHEEEELM